MFEPGHVEARLHVEPGGRRREIFLELAGERFYRSSAWSIRSDPDAPTVQPPVIYRELPAGEYVVTAVLTECSPGGCGRRVELARVVDRLQVVGIQ